MAIEVLPKQMVHQCRWTGYNLVALSLNAGRAFPRRAFLKEPLMSALIVLSPSSLLLIPDGDAPEGKC
jgi:hypothetical protein